MGYSSSAKLLVGAKIEKSYRTVTSTKYDEDTGAPYEVQKREEFLLLVGKEVNIDDLLESMDKVPSVWYVNPDSDDLYFGLLVGTVQSGACAVSEESIQAAKEKVRESLNLSGMECDLGLFLIHMESY